VRNLRIDNICLYTIEFSSGILDVITVRPLLTEHDLAELADLLADRVGTSGGRRGRSGSERTGTLLTADELAEILGVPTGWIYRQSRAGAIPTVKLGRYYRYRLEAIERWIVEREDAA
jgi:excisionase family DNA binding protein